MALDIKISFSWVNYCRLCLLDKGLKIPIFEKDGLNENIPLKIKECLNITSYDGDPLPRMICHQCLCKLNTAYELRQKALESFKLLLQHLQPLIHVPSVNAFMQDANVTANLADNPEKDVQAESDSKPSHGQRSGSEELSKPIVEETTTSQKLRSVRSRTTRSRSAGKALNAAAESPPLAQKGSITIVPNIENPSLTSSVKELSPVAPPEPMDVTPVAAFSSKPVEAVPPTSRIVPEGETLETAPSTSKTLEAAAFPLKRLEGLDDSHAENSESDAYEEPGKRKRKRITDYFDEALMASGGNLVLATTRGRRRKRVGPASRTRALSDQIYQTGPSPWQCVLCSCYFPSHNVLRRHLTHCLLCETCGEEFASLKEKAVHEQSHMVVNLSLGAEIPNKCHRCPQAYASLLMLKQHLRYDHENLADKSLRSDTADSSLKANDGGQSLPGSEGSATPEDCDNCDCASGSSEGEASESATNEPGADKVQEGQEVLSCGKCGRHFYTKQRLAYHLHVHDSLIKCSFCPWMFPYGPGRRRHQRLVHGDKSEPISFKCSVCKESFESKSILLLHRKSHKKDTVGDEDDRDLSKSGGSRSNELEHCHLCDKLVKSNKLMQHLYQHASDAYDKEAEKSDKDKNSIQCKVCHMTCPNKDYYKLHMAKHMLIKSNFSCEGCCQVFANLDAINRHPCPGKQTDNDFKNCQHCGQALSTQVKHVCDNECKQCHKIFKSARGQRLHTQTKHEHTDPAVTEVNGAPDGHVTPTKEEPPETPSEGDDSQSLPERDVAVDASDRSTYAPDSTTTPKSTSPVAVAVAIAQLDGLDKSATPSRELMKHVVTGQRAPTNDKSPQVVDTSTNVADTPSFVKAANVETNVIVKPRNLSNKPTDVVDRAVNLSSKPAIVSDKIHQSDKMTIFAEGQITSEKPMYQAPKGTPKIRLRPTQALVALSTLVPTTDIKQLPDATPHFSKLSLSAHPKHIVSPHINVPVSRGSDASENQLRKYSIPFTHMSELSQGRMAGNVPNPAFSPPTALMTNVPPRPQPPTPNASLVRCQTLPTQIIPSPNSGRPMPPANVPRQMPLSNWSVITSPPQTALNTKSVICSPTHDTSANFSKGLSQMEKDHVSANSPQNIRCVQLAALQATPPSSTFAPLGQIPPNQTVNYNRLFKDIPSSNNICSPLRSLLSTESSALNESLYKK